MNNFRVEVKLEKEWIPLNLPFEDSDDAIRKARSISNNEHISTRVVNPSRKCSEEDIALVYSFWWEMREMSYGYVGEYVEDVTIHK